MDIVLWALPPLLSPKPLPLPPWSLLFGYEWGVISLEGQDPQRAGVKSAMHGLAHLMPSLGIGSPCCLGQFSSPHSMQQQAQETYQWLPGSWSQTSQTFYHTVLFPFPSFPTTWFLNPTVPNPSTLTHLRRGWTEPIASWCTAFFLDTFHSRAEVQLHMESFLW